jgi:uncharacterized phiE125 gp8 family phage protein
MIVPVLATLATSPVTLEEARRHCRITDTAENSVIEGMITGATDVCQNLTSRQFLTATRVDEFDSFPAEELELGRWPLVSVTSIVYVDADGDEQTWTASLYQSDTTAEPPRIKPAYNESWPTIRSGIYAAVTVTYTAGYGATASLVPDRFKQAIMLLVGHWYNHREAYEDRDTKEVAMALHALLGMDRVRTFT